MACGLGCLPCGRTMFCSCVAVSRLLIRAASDLPMYPLSALGFFALGGCASKRVTSEETACRNRVQRNLGTDRNSRRAVPLDVGELARRAGKGRLIDAIVRRRSRDPEDFHLERQARGKCPDRDGGLRRPLFVLDRQRLDGLGLAERETLLVLVGGDFQEAIPQEVGTRGIRRSAPRRIAVGLLARRNSART